MQMVIKVSVETCMAKVKGNNVLKKYFVGVNVKYCVIKNVAVKITVL